MDLAPKAIAWNGIFLEIPGQWEVSRIGMRHLVFEFHSKAVMEIKWQRIKGRFSAPSHLKRLARGHGGPLKRTIRSWALPSSWRSAVQGYEAHGFQWHTMDGNGHGIILFCPDCRTASLIQFINLAGNDISALPPLILNSFKDHRTDHQCLWSIFDIRCRLPADFRLGRYRFHPGSYELTFEKDTTSLVLFRWAPAGMLLADQTLADFGVGVLDPLSDADADTAVSESNGFPAVEWHQGPRGHRFVYRFRSRPLYHSARIWHVASKNRILGIHLMDKKPVDHRLLETLCAAYETL